ncbi:MAG TPA: hypothetical protein VML19_29910 [Verrucomicrobiae bacterium]|nr:hypothetical protein [Verrucomicrobiae bacterium]
MFSFRIALLVAVAAVNALAQTQAAGGGNPTNPTGVYTAAYALNGGTASQSGQTYSAINDYEFGVEVLSGGVLTLTNPAISTTGQIGNGVEAGLNNSTTPSTVTLTGATITTSGLGANGLFAAAGGASITMTGGSILCTAQFGHGVLAVSSGSVTLNNVSITTRGGNGAAMANDIAAATITANGVTAVTSGQGSPGIYAIGSGTVITANNSSLTAIVETGVASTGGGRVVLTNTAVTGAGSAIKTLNQGSATSTVTVTGGSLKSTSGDVIYGTGEPLTVSLSGGTTVTAASGNLVNAATSGVITLNLSGETVSGALVADSTSTITANLQNQTAWSGAATNAAVTLDATSSWNVTSNSTVTTLSDSAGISGTSITNISGNGYIVYYNGSLSGNSYLGGKTYTLANGGYLAPAGTTIVASPSINSGGAANAASGAAGIAPGAWISIYGSNLATGKAQVGTTDLVNGYLPQKFQGTSVTIDGKPAYIDYASPSQLNIQAPADNSTGPVTVTVTTSSGSSSITSTLAQVMPGIFMAEGYALAVRNGDGAILSAALPAKPGDVISLYATGLAATSPAVDPGLVFSGTYYLASPTPSVTIGGTNAAVSFAGLVGAGLYQINLTVPSTLATGSYPVVIAQSGASSPSALLSVSAN